MNNSDKIQQSYTLRYSEEMNTNLIYSYNEQDVADPISIQYNGAPINDRVSEIINILIERWTALDRLPEDKKTDYTAYLKDSIKDQKDKLNNLQNTLTNILAQIDYELAEAKSIIREANRKTK